MGTIMTLLKVTQELENFDKEDTIYAAKPWTENSKAIVLREPESGELPNIDKELDLKYFLEIFIAHDFITEWASSLNTLPTLQEKCSKLI